MTRRGTIVIPLLLALAGFTGAAQSPIDNAGRRLIARLKEAEIETGVQRFACDSDGQVTGTKTFKPCRISPGWSESGSGVQGTR